MRKPPSISAASTPLDMRSVWAFLVGEKLGTSFATMVSPDSDVVVRRHFFERATSRRKCPAETGQGLVALSPTGTVTREVSAIHPNGDAFWNRNDAFRALGFDRFIDGDTFVDSEWHGDFVGDAAPVDRIIAELEDGGPRNVEPAAQLADRNGVAIVFKSLLDRVDHFSSSPSRDRRARSSSIASP
jgi:hypothetical protein